VPDEPEPEVVEAEQPAAVAAGVEHLDDEHIERQYGGRYAAAATTGDHDLTIDLASLGAVVPAIPARRNAGDPGWPTGWGPREDEGAAAPDIVIAASADSGWPLAAEESAAPAGPPAQITTQTRPSAQTGPGVIPGGRRKPVFSDERGAGDEPDTRTAPDR
jgi:hypothetical protein